MNSHNNHNSHDDFNSQDGYNSNNQFFALGQFEKVLKILFFIFNFANIQFVAGLETYIIVETLLIIEQIELFNIKKFTAVALGANNKTF